MNVLFVPSTEWHAMQVANNMRHEDAEECRALGLDLHDACLTSVEESDFTATMLVDGEVAAIAGLTHVERPALARSRAVVWLLTTPAVEKAPYALHSTARMWVRRGLALSDVLYNYVDARYTRSLRWLEALGFRIHPAAPHGPHGLPFHLVTKEA